MSKSNSKYSVRLKYLKKLTIGIMLICTKIHETDFFLTFRIFTNHCRSLENKNNSASLIIGEIAGFLLFVVACFQSSLVPIVHYVAASTMFPLYLIYMIMQVRLSFAVRRFVSIPASKKPSTFILWTRLMLTTLGCLSWLAGSTFAILWVMEGEKMKKRNHQF